MVSINDITPNIYNPNRMDKVTFDKMKEVIKEKGLFGTIIVRKWGDWYQILDGEHRWKACKELGFSEIPVECAKNEMTENDVRFWTIYFNNTRGKDDIETRAKLLGQLDAGQTALLPWTADEIENEKQLFKFDFSQYDKQDDIPEKDITSIIQIVVPEEVKNLWNAALKLGFEYGMNDVQVIVKCLEYFMTLRKGLAKSNGKKNM